MKEKVTQTFNIGPYQGVSPLLAIKKVGYRLERIERKGSKAVVTWVRRPKVTKLK